MEKILKFKNEEIIQNLEILETKRAKIAKNLRILKVASFALIFALLPVLLRFVPDLLISSIICVFASLMFFSISHARLITPFNARFKDEILSLIAKDENLSYERKKFFEFAEFNAPGFYESGFSVYRGDDFFAGEIEGVRVQFCDIYLAKQTQTNTNQKQTPKLTTLFYGITLIAEFNQNFASTLHVIDTNARANSHLKRVSMDNAEFEQYFRTYSLDPISAHYILTPKFMEQLIALRDYFKAPLSLACEGGKIWLYIALGKNSFEPNISYPLLGENSPAITLKKELEKFKILAKILKNNQKAFVEKI
ncbi:MAG: DUF3137 domain-containing protein [Campylobacter sp.]|nr:DUF3137 domain-containing protein [Campylobacter sp.]